MADPQAKLELIELHSKEVELIKRLRLMGHGEVTIKVRDGRPAMLVRIMIMDDLTPVDK